MILCCLGSRPLRRVPCKALCRVLYIALSRVLCRALWRFLCKAVWRVLCKALRRVLCRTLWRVLCKALWRALCWALWRVLWWALWGVLCRALCIVLRRALCTVLCRVQRNQIKNMVRIQKLDNNNNITIIEAYLVIGIAALLLLICMRHSITTSRLSSSSMWNVTSRGAQMQSQACRLIMRIFHFICSATEGTKFKQFLWEL